MKDPNVYQKFCGVSVMRDQEREVVQEVAAESNTESEVIGMRRIATTHRRGQSGGKDSGGLGWMKKSGYGGIREGCYR